MQSETGKLSALSAITTVAELGLELDGRRAHLIPFKNEITLVVDYKGLVELVMRNKDIVSIHADVVCENDIFNYSKGIVQDHIINFKEARGKVYAVYAVVTFTNGSEKAEVMTFDEVEKIRLNAPGKNSDPWTKWWNEMAKKTVFKRLCKWLPLPAKAQDAITHDDNEYINVTPVKSKFETLQLKGEQS
jgi:recombination protein RecT